MGTVIGCDQHRAGPRYCQAERKYVFMPTHASKLYTAAAAVLFLAVAPTVSASASPPAPAAAGLSISPVSNPRPDMVSGGQVLLRVTAGPRLRDKSVQVEANGRDVTGAFQQQSDGTLLGLVKGLRVGDNVVSATAGRDRARLTVIDHSISGPVFSGPQQVPFYCETTAFGLA